MSGLSDNERGLYAKYKVNRLDGKPVDQVFVLEFNDPNTWPALKTYAETVRYSYPYLAADIDKLIDEHRERLYREGRL